MKIVSFTSEKLHGYLNLYIEMKPGITFLTGINGSGKTSAVRSITSLLTPSLTSLANASYAMLSVTVDNNGLETTITCKRNDAEMEISCSDAQGVAPLILPILRPEAYESQNRFYERRKEFYREQETIYSQQAVLLAIKRLPTPMFLDLERRRQEGTRTRRDSSRLISRALPVNPLAGSLMESLNDAQDLAEARFRRFLEQRSELTDTLKQDLILSAFRRGQVSDQLDLWTQRPEFLTDLETTSVS